MSNEVPNRKKGRKDEEAADEEVADEEVKR
jgi:hypothetical protein